MMRVIVVDDHEIVREGLTATLSSPSTRVIGGAGTGREALALVQRLAPDVAIIDLRLPDMTGIELCRRLVALRPSTAVVVLSTYISEETVRAALGAGAAAYVTKAAGLAKLRETLASLDAKPDTRGEVLQAPAIVKQLHRLASEHAGGVRVTPQQQRVLELAAQGLTNREVGERLFISESTVRFHIQRLKRTLDAKTKTELIAKAIRGGMIEPAPEDVSLANTPPRRARG
jgi:DNA-binding NarL/FixJ family response regulator